MTSDRDTTTDELFNTIHALWLKEQGVTGDDVPSGGFGQRVTSLRDEEIASATGLELGVVREYLDNANGAQLVVDSDGDSRRVTAVL